MNSRTVLASASTLLVILAACTAVPAEPVDHAAEPLHAAPLSGSCGFWERSVCEGVIFDQCFGPCLAGALDGASACRSCLDDAFTFGIDCFACLSAGGGASGPGGKDPGSCTPGAIGCGGGGGRDPRGGHGTGGGPHVECNDCVYAPKAGWSKECCIMNATEEATSCRAFACARSNAN